MEADAPSERWKMARLDWMCAEEDARTLSVSSQQFYGPDFIDKSWSDGGEEEWMRFQYFYANSKHAMDDRRKFEKRINATVRKAWKNFKGQPVHAPFFTGDQVMKKTGTNKGVVGTVRSVEGDECEVVAGNDIDSMENKTSWPQQKCSNFEFIEKIPNTGFLSQMRKPAEEEEKMEKALEAKKEIKKEVKKEKM